MVEAAGVHGGGGVVFVDEGFQGAELAVGFGAGERRGEVVDDDGLGAALGLRALAGVVDDEGVEVGHRAEDGFGEAGFGEGGGLAGEPLEGAVLAEVDDGVGAEVSRSQR